jgi:hypothetical protein
MNGPKGVAWVRHAGLMAAIILSGERTACRYALLEKIHQIFNAVY